MAKYFGLTVLSIVLVSFAGCGGGEEDNQSAGVDSTLNTQLPGGGGNPGNDVAAGGGESSNSARDTQRNPQGSNERNGSDGETELVSTSTRNGLFPNFESGNESSGPSSGFGGALFPRADNSGSSSASNGDSSATDVAASPPDSDPFDLGEGDDVADASTDSDPFSESVSSSPKITLLLDAKRLFERHDESAAVSYVYANHLVSNDARREYQLDWYPGLKEPRLFFRWGVGVIFNKPKDFDGRHPVIGDPGDENEGASQSSQGNTRRGGGGAPGLGNPSASGSGGSRRSGGGGSRIYKNVDTSRPDGSLLYYTGDFGEKLISYLDSRREDEEAPYYGQILKDVLEVEEPEDDQQVADSGSSSATGRRGGPGGGGLQTGTGNVGVFGDDTNTATGRGRNNRGRNNNSQPLQRTDTSVIDRAMGTSTAQRPEDDFSGTIIPGVHLIGKGSKSELIDRAKKADIDALILFNVKISKSRGSRNRQNSAPSYTNTTSLRIVDVKTEENLFSSKSLKDTDVEEDNDDGEDPVKDQVERAFATFADKQFKALKLPSSINQTNVKKRIGSLLKSNPDPLRAAVEIVSFYESKLLTEKLATTAMTRLFDDEQAAVLVNGTPSERLNFLRDKLPEGAGE